MKKTIKAFKAYIASLGFYEAPASTRFHGAYAGGLAEHCEAVYGELKRLNKRFKTGLSREQVFLLAYGHDLCKCDAYRRNPDGSFEHNPGQADFRHGAKSLDLCRAFPGWETIATPEMEQAIVCHMGVWSNDLPLAEGASVASTIGKALKVTKEYNGNVVYILQVADMFASRVVGK